MKHTNVCLFIYLQCTELTYHWGIKWLTFFELTRLLGIQITYSKKVSINIFGKLYF